MRVTEVAEHPPRKCAVTGRADGPFIDFQKIIGGPQPTALYLHTLIVEEAAKKLGMVPAKEVDALREQFAELEATLTRVEEIQKTAGKLDELIGSEKE